MSPGENFEVSYGPRARKVMAPLDGTALSLAVAEEVRSRFDQHQKVAPGIHLADLVFAGRRFQFLWRRKGHRIGVLDLAEGQLTETAVLESIAYFQGGS